MSVSSSLIAELCKRAEEVEALTRVVRLQQEQNLFLQQQFDCVAGWLNKHDDEDTDAHVTMAIDELIEAQQKLEPPKLPYADAVHASFHWRDPARADGLYDALPGDGFGFLGATQFKLTLQFDCAGVHACADIPFEQLRWALAKRGLTIETTDFGRVPRRAYFDVVERAEKESTRAELAEAKADKLERQLVYVDKLTEQIATVEDRRVLDVVAGLPNSALVFMSSQLGPGASLTAKARQALDHLVSFELARRIQNADLDLPLYMSESEIVENRHDELFELLDEAQAEGEKAKALTPEQREDRYEAFIRAKGWLKEGETLDRNKWRNKQQQGSTDESSMQVRDVPSDGAPESEPD